MTERGIATRTRWIVAAALLLATAAMLRYPGGTALNSTTEGYSMSANFLSDLGMTVAYDQQRNWLGAALFVASLLTLVAGLGGILVRLGSRLSANPLSRRWSRAALVSGLLAALLFAGVAVTPENQMMSLHVAFTHWAWRIVPVAAALFAVASFRAPDMRRHAGWAWLLLALFLSGYAGYLEWGPDLTTMSGLTAQVMAQKGITALLLVTFLLVTHTVDRTASTRGVPTLDGR